MTDSEPSQPTSNSPSTRHPRALAHGTGVIFQTAGLVLTFASCCIGSLAGLAQHPNRAALLGDTPVTVVEAWHAFETHRKLATVSMFASCAAGLGVLAAGIGLQADRFGSARLAVMVTLPLGLFHLFYLGHLIVYGPLKWWFPAPLFYAAVWTGLSILALASASVHRSHPPPRGLDVLPPQIRLPGTTGERLAEQLRESDHTS